jgi:hypothetical protein
MLVRVTCDGVVIGTADFQLAEGLAHAVLSPAAAYVLADSAARSLGRQLTRRQYWTAVRGDFACVAAARWEGGRLAIQDMNGRELCADNIVVAERPPGVPGEHTVRVVADFRSDVARIQARFRSDPGCAERNRPAA